MILVWFLLFICSDAHSSRLPREGLWEQQSLSPCKFFAVSLWSVYLKVSLDGYKIALSTEGQPLLSHMLPPYYSGSHSGFLFCVLVFYCYCNKL